MAGIFLMKIMDALVRNDIPDIVMGVSNFYGIFSFHPILSNIDLLSKAILLPVSCTPLL